MPGVDFYRAALREAGDPEPFLRSHSGLPGPRGNLELAAAMAEVGAEEQFRRWAALSPDEAPENTPGVFLVFCGALGLGELLARRGGRLRIEDTPLRALASDPRWRVREAVATGLQRWGDADMEALLAEMAGWATGNRWEQRAAAAALCEPRLLVKPGRAAAVLGVLDGITATIPDAHDRKSEAFKTLRQALGYCWSVATAAQPAAGLPAFERWAASDNPDVRWIVRENLKKKRLSTVAPEWVRGQLAELE